MTATDKLLGATMLAAALALLAYWTAWALVSVRAGGGRGYELLRIARAVVREDVPAVVARGSHMSSSTRCKMLCGKSLTTCCAASKRVRWRYLTREPMPRPAVVEATALRARGHAGLTDNFACVAALYTAEQLRAHAAAPSDTGVRIAGMRQPAGWHGLRDSAHTIYLAILMMAMQR